jgi:drug/metabolite transporter (DMT)-like permease
VTARAWAALATVYVVWGSTYLAIMLAIRTMPPFLMSSARFLLAGLLVLPLVRGAGRPGLRQWLAAAVAGGAMFVVGNGGITWAEKRVDSGAAALLVATAPLWMALLDRVRGRRLSRSAIAGLAVGLVGVALLVGPGAGAVDLVGGGICVLSAAAWAAGSLYSRDAPLPPSPFLAAAMQMLTGGALLGILGLALGEAGDVHPARVSLESVLGLAFLVVFGSIVAFTAYVWLLEHVPTAIVSTYAYVNPVVAVLLGAAFLGEPLGLRTLAAGAAIVVSVVLIVSADVRVRVRALPLRPAFAALRRGGPAG